MRPEGPREPSPGAEPFRTNLSRPFRPRGKSASRDPGHRLRPKPWAPISRPVGPVGSGAQVITWQALSLFLRPSLRQSGSHRAPEIAKLAPLWDRGEGLPAPLAELPFLEIDLLDIGRGPHDALRLPAVDEAEGVPQLVDGFLFRPFDEPLFVGRGPVELGCQPVERDDRRAPRELGLAEHIGEDRNEEIDAGHSQNSGKPRARTSLELGQEEGRVVLPAGRVERALGIEPGAADLDVETEGRGETALQVTQEVPPFRQIDRDHRNPTHLSSTAAGWGRSYYLILL